MKRLFPLPPLLVSLAFTLILAACTQAAATRTEVPSSAATATPIPPAPRTVTVLVGAGQDTTVVSAFFPSKVRIREGDTVTWRINSDEPQTVTFLSGMPLPPFVVPVPGGGPTDFMLNPQVAFPTRLPGTPIEVYDGTSYVNSGIVSRQSPAPGVPPNDTFSLTFTRPGTYQYITRVQSFIPATVEVVPTTASDVPSQVEIDSQGQAEMATLLAKVDRARAQGRVARSEPGPDGTTTWFLRAGNTDFIDADPRAEAYEFLPKELTIKAGDTVVWASAFYHTITFVPGPPPPEFLVIKPQPQGSPFVTLNLQVVVPAKPLAVFDATKYFNSGPIGPLSPFGNSWALSFDRPGMVSYFCAVHRELGMEGSITVQPR